MFCCTIHTARCDSEGNKERGLLQPVEGIHSILLTCRPPHSADLHLLGAAKVLVPAGPVTPSEPAACHCTCFVYVCIILRCSVMGARVHVNTISLECNDRVCLKRELGIVNNS